VQQRHALRAVALEHLETLALADAKLFSSRRGRATGGVGLDRGAHDRRGRDAGRAASEAAFAASQRVASRSRGVDRSGGVG